jgi:hypothetical protein
MATIRKATPADQPKTIDLLKQFPPDPELPKLNWDRKRPVAGHSR